MGGINPVIPNPTVVPKSLGQSGGNGRGPEFPRTGETESNTSKHLDPFFLKKKHYIQ